VKPGSAKYSTFCDILADVFLAGKRSILDLGFGKADFLKLAYDNGFYTTGIDVSKYAVECAKKKGLKSVYYGELKDIKFKERFEVITMLDVIEHIPNVMETLKLVRKNLKDDGMLIIRTPNANSIYHSIASFFYMFNLYKTVEIIYHKDHVYYFTRTTLVNLLRQSGFRKISVKMNDQSEAFSTNPIIKFMVSIIRGIGKLTNKQHAMLVVARK